MSDAEKTVSVSADQYDVPSEYDQDTIDIGVSPYNDKVYLQFPRFERTGTNDFCVNATSLFKSLIRVRSNNDTVQVDPVLKKLGVLSDDASLFTHQPDGIFTTVIGDKSDAAYTHLKLVEEFSSTVGDVTENPYWSGYRVGARSSGGSFTWAEIAWRAFDSEWDGNTALMLEAGQWLAQNGWAVCSRSDALFPIPEWTTPTGSYVATVSTVFDGTCPSCGADKDENWECIRSSNSTMRANRYKCESCGHTANGTTTG